MRARKEELNFGDINMPNLLETRTHCPICNDTRSFILLEAAYDATPIKQYLEAFYISQGHIDHQLISKGSYTLLHCPHCQLIFQKEIPNDLFMEKLYEEWINPQIAYERSRAISPKNLLKRLYSFHEILRILLYLNKKPSKLSLYDFGAGWCEWASMAEKIGANVYCSEISESRIKNAKKLGIKVIDWEDIPRNQFDYINTEQVFEHLAEPRETLKHLKKALNDTGIIKISVPNGNNIANNLKDLELSSKTLFKLNPIAPLEHINCFSHQSLLILANMEGLELISKPKWFTISLFQLARLIIKPAQSRTKSTYLFFKKKAKN